MCAARAEVDRLIVAAAAGNQRPQARDVNSVALRIASAPELGSNALMAPSPKLPISSELANTPKLRVHHL
jgi:hypothetical protein